MYNVHGSSLWAVRRAPLTKLVCPPERGRMQGLLGTQGSQSNFKAGA